MWYYNTRKGKGNKKMTIYREHLVDRLTRIYGPKNPIVIEFCGYCERWADSEKNDMLLALYVETEGRYPAIKKD